MVRIQFYRKKSVITDKVVKGKFISDIWRITYREISAFFLNLIPKVHLELRERLFKVFKKNLLCVKNFYEASEMLF